MIEQQILQQLKMLPAVKQVEVLDFTEFLVKKNQTHIDFLTYLLRCQTGSIDFKLK